MMVSVARTISHSHDPPGFVLTDLHPAGVLVHHVGIGAGVRVGVDVTAPCRWLSVSAPVLDETTRPLLRALIGDHAVPRLTALLDRLPAAERPAGPETVEVDPVDSAPWMRVAIVGGLDRWLQLPLDQALVDAERGVAMARAARTLPADGATRALVITEALELARRASGGVVRQLRFLTRRAAVAPSLSQALEGVVRGYDALLAEVDGGADSALLAVPRAWRRLVDALPDRPAVRARATARRRPGRGAGERAGSRIDPRQVRARVVALSDDPSTAEIRLVDTSTSDGPVVTVRVPAFGRSVDRDVAPRLLVRLIDPRSAAAVGQSVLTPAAAAGRRGARPYFEGMVRVEGPVSGELRADVFDALSTVPPVGSEQDEELSQARRATIFLGGWRRLCARVELRNDRVDLAESLRTLSARVSAPAGTDPSRPLFAGGPSASDILRLTDLDVDEFRTAGGRPCPRGLLRMAHGPGELLAAELAAAQTD